MNLTQAHIPRLGGIGSMASKVLSIIAKWLCETEPAGR